MAESKSSATVPKDELTREHLPAIYDALALPFTDKGAVQRTKGQQTKKGYDTTGYGYQFIVNRLNEVVGVGHWRAHFQDLRELQGTYQNGREKWTVNVVCHLELGNWSAGVWNPLASSEMPGGHESAELTSAHKGAYTNALKKTAGNFGIGREAYEGTVDEDNAPLAEAPGTTPTVRPAPQGEANSDAESRRSGGAGNDGEANAKAARGEAGSQPSPPRFAKQELAKAWIDAQVIIAQNTNDSAEGELRAYLKQTGTALGKLTVEVVERAEGIAKGKLRFDGADVVQQEAIA